MQSLAFTTKPKAGEVDELEALLAAQRLSFLASSTTIASAGSLREAIADFRGALNPRSHVTSSPALSQVEIPSQPPVYPKNETKTSELDTEAPAPCVCLERADKVVSEIVNHIEVIHAKSAAETSRLVDIIMELKMELKDLCATMEASKRDPRSQDNDFSWSPKEQPHIIHVLSPCRTPGPDAARLGAASPPLSELPVPPSPIPYAMTPVRAGLMSPVPIQIPSQQHTPRWVEDGVHNAFTPQPVRLGSPQPSRPHSPAPSRGWVPVSPAPPVPTECHPRTPIPVGSPVQLMASFPLRNGVPDVATSRVEDHTQLPSEQTEPTRDCTCQTVTVKTSSKKGGKWKKKGSSKSKDVLKKCANCISKENATLETNEERPRPLPTLVLSMPGMVSPAQAPQPASPLTPLPDPCVPIACLAIGSPIPGSSLPESRALGSALSPQLGGDPTTPIRVPPCNVITPATPPRAFRIPPPVLTPASNGSILPSNLCQVATALNSFLTLQEDELAFDRGDTILVLDTPAHPTGWLLGQHSSGRRGLFPARYVKLAP